MSNENSPPLRSLDDTQQSPSTIAMHCGDFYDKAMAIDDVLERLAFLNRGQDQVVRKLDGLMQRVDDAELHADL